MSDVLVETRSGIVRGRRDAGTGLTSFLGVPYAEPPVGPLRFRPPRPITPWPGVRDALAFGPASAQVFDPQEALIEDLGGDPAAPAPTFVGSEDSLTLNIWTPAADRGRRPVLVFIHGGANWLESSRIPGYHGDRFAARGDVVFVSFNYRLGIFGFLDVSVLDAGYAGADHNGLRDQALALRWVKDNVAAFGGDPAAITVMGESAGSVDTSWLLASGALDGIARRVVLMSGVATVSTNPLRHGDTVEDGRALARDLLGRAGFRTMAELLSAPTGAVLEAHARLIPAFHMLAVDSWFYPRRDGPSDVSPYDWAASRQASAIDVMIGTTAYEMGLWLLWDGELDQRPFATTVQFLGDLDDSTRRDLERLYARAFPDEGEGRRGMRLLGDAVFVMPSVRFAELRASAGGRTWFYQFAWAIPGSTMGAAHAVDLSFAFDKMDTVMSRRLFTPPTDPADEARRQRLAHAFQDAILAFVRDGDPNRAAGSPLPVWRPYTAEDRAVMRLDLDSRLIDDPYGPRREMWMPLLEQTGD